MNTETLITVMSGAFGVKILDMLWKFVERKWLKKDTESADIKAIKMGTCASLRDRIRYLCKKYISEGYIDSDDHADLIGMHTAYHNLGGNGHLDLMMSKVNELKYK